MRRDAHHDGKYLLRTPDELLTPADIADAYKSLYQAERGWRDLKTTQINLRPVFTTRTNASKPTSSCAGSRCCCLRVAEHAVGGTWRNMRDELDRLHLVTLATADGEVAQRGQLMPTQLALLRTLELPEPPRFFDFTPTSS